MTRSNGIIPSLVMVGLAAVGGYLVYKTVSEKAEGFLPSKESAPDPVAAARAHVIAVVQAKLAASPTALSAPFEGAVWSADSIKDAWVVFASGGKLKQEMAFSVSKTDVVTGPMPGSAVRTGMELATKVPEGLQKLI